MGIPDHLTCLLRNLYMGEEPTVSTRHGTRDWFKLGKEYIKDMYCHLAYLIYIQSTSHDMPGWMNPKLESRLPGEISGEDNGSPLQYSCLENPRGGGAWWAVVHGVAKSRTRLKQLSSSSSRRVRLEKAMTTHSSILAWKIPWAEEPGRRQFMGSRRVGHDWETSLSLFTFMHWRRKWQPTPVFLPGESQGWGSLVGCRLWGRTESDTTEVTEQ